MFVFTSLLLKSRVLGLKAANKLSLLEARDLKLLFNKKLLRFIAARYYIIINIIYQL